MARRLDGAKPLSEPMLPYCAFFNHENDFENVVCKMAAICLGLNALTLYAETTCNKG